MALSSENKSSRLFKELMGVSESKMTREFFEEPIRSSPAVLPSQVWKYGSWLPTGSANDLAGPNAILAIQALTADQQEYSVQIDESTSIPLVRRWITRQFTIIDGGTNNAFKLLDDLGDPITNIVPFNFGDGTSYNYNLYRSDGITPIAFGIGDWVLDSNSGVLTFYNIAGVTGVDIAHPPCLSFFQYIGGTGVPDTVAGYEGVILNIPGYSGAANTSAWSNVALDNALILAANRVQSGFITTYGWDGNDTHEGVAVAFQKLVPLTYSQTKDPVKTGFGVNAAEVMTILARRNASIGLVNITGFNIDFISQGIPTGNTVQLRYNAGTLDLSIDSGASWGVAVSGADTLAVQSAIKVKNGSEFVVLRRIPGALPGAGDNIDTITIVDTQTRIGLFNWDSDANDYVPYVNTEAATSFDLGFPVVTKLGKIPPSLSIGSTSTGGFVDIITPQYYGVRSATIIVAVQDNNTMANSTVNLTGADYIVSNVTGGYLDDVLTEIYGSYPNFTGEIILRSGRYLVDQDISLISGIGATLKGEARGSVIIDSNGATRTIHVTASSAENITTFDSIVFSGAFIFDILTTGASPSSLVLERCIGPAIDITVAEECGVILVECSSLHNFTVTGTGATVFRRILESTFNIVTVNGTDTAFHGAIISQLIGQTNGIGNVFINCQITTLTSLQENNNYIGNSVTTFGVAVTEKFKMSPQKLEVIDADGTTRRWTSFADPIGWDAVNNRFTLKIDSTLSINGLGQLSATSGDIPFDNTGVLRADGTAVTADTVPEALVDIYLHKADLDNSGRLNINQLPESLAGGGLIYKGLWSFVTSGGAYPTAAQLGGVALGVGWFVVISASSTDSSNPVAAQTAADFQIYTAGDWAVYNGTGWNKVDNSFADPSYAILPSTPPDGAWSDGLFSFGGTTIVSATDQINETLAKLAPAKPVDLSTMSLSVVNATAYSASEAGTGTVRTEIVPTTLPELSTPAGPNSISTLFFDGDAGSLTAYIDTVASGTIALTSASNVGTTGSLVIAADADPWLGEAGKQGFWKGLRAGILPSAALSLGAHYFYLLHSVTGNTPVLTLYVDNPATTMSVAGATITTTPSMSTYVSGVPSVAASAQFILSTATAVGVVGKFYNTTQVIRLTNNAGAAAQSLPASSTPAAPIDGNYGDAVVASSTVTIPSSSYIENIEFTLTPYNSNAVSGVPAVLTSGSRVDTTTETERVRSGDPTLVYPVIETGAGCGAAFDNQISLVSGYVAELQKLQNHYRWPAGNYSGYTGTLGPGPDYSSAAGSTISGLAGEWRWVTILLPNALTNISSLSLDFTGSLVGFTADTNQITANMLIYLKVVGASGTGWLDANAPYSGSGAPVADGDAAMIAGTSTASSKKITFGPVVRTGSVYVRVGIRSTSGISFGGVALNSLA